MKTTEYKCNLCGDRKECGELSGIHFIRAKDFEYRLPHTCHTHLCHDCIETIIKLNKIEKKCSISP